MKGLGDQALLAEITQRDSDYHVRRTAVEKVTDQTLLAELARKAGDYHVRRVAVEKVTIRPYWRRLPKRPVTITYAGLRWRR